jgi:hypothetical protein
MYYFSSSSGLGADRTKTVPGHVTPTLCFWQITKYILVRPGRKMSKLYFSCYGGPGMDPKNSTQGHITLNLCFCIWWERWIT